MTCSRALVARPEACRYFYDYLVASAVAEYISPGEPITEISVKFTEIAVTLLILLVALCGREYGSRALCGRIQRDLAVILSVDSL
jgi:hypothetical protein